MSWGQGRWGVVAAISSPTDIQPYTRYGAFLPDIPPTRRAGDYAHACARLLNAVFKRLAVEVSAWGPRAAADLQPACDARRLLGESTRLVMLQEGGCEGGNELAL